MRRNLKRPERGSGISQSPSTRCVRGGSHRGWTWITLEFDVEGGLIGVEILQASQVLRDVLKPLAAKAEADG